MINKEGMLLVSLLTASKALQFLKEALLLFLFLSWNQVKKCSRKKENIFKQICCKRNKNLMIKQRKPWKNVAQFKMTFVFAFCGHMWPCVTYCGLALPFLGKIFWKTIDLIRLWSFLAVIDPNSFLSCFKWKLHLFWLS